jgi:hypothetical protein
MSAHNTPFCLHIPVMKKTYSAELIKNIFWRHFLGNIDRVDFVPIVRSIDCNDDLIQEDKIFHQAFIYKEERENWSADLMREIEEKTYYELNFTPCEQEKDKPDCWKIQKSTITIPYANTKLNIHQLNHENVLLKAKLAEFEKELLELKNNN